MNLRIGCCGFPVGRQQYYEKFKVVELQKSFYQPPKIETAIKWRESAPSDLKRLLGFCPLKLPTYAMFNNTSMWEDAAKFKRLSGT